MKFQSESKHFHSRKYTSNSVCEMASILSRSQCVNSRHSTHIVWLLGCGVICVWIVPYQFQKTRTGDYNSPGFWVAQSMICRTNKKSYSFTAEIVILQWTLWHKLPELHLNSSHAISCCVWIVIIYHGTYYSIRIVCLLISFFALPIQTVLYWGRVYVS